MKRVDVEQWRAREVSRLLALVEAERRYYQEIIASMPVGVAILSKEPAFLSANRAFRDVFGLSSRALAQTRLAHLFPAGELGNRIQEVLESGVAQRDVIVNYVAAGGPKPLRISIQPFYGWDEENNSEALLIVQDLEAKPSGEESPVESHAGPLLETLEAVVWERDPATLDFTYVGGRATELLGFPPADWTATPDFYEARIHPHDRDWVVAFYRATVSASAPRSCEYRALTREGHTVWLRDVIRVTRREDGAAERLSGITVNISTEKLRDEQIIQAEKMAALGRLAGRVTHDCNNLLMILSGYSEELLDSLPNGHPARDSVEEILSATDRLAGLTTELLQFTRRPSLSPRVFNLNALLENVEPGLRRELGENIGLTLDLAPDLRPVKADWDQTADVILTLGRDARQAMPDGGQLHIRTANVEILDGSPQACETLSPGHYAAVSLADTGPTLDEDTQRRLFEPFFSSGRSGENLASVYTIVRNSGGDIRVTSGAAGGACFTIYLPVAELRKAPAAPPVAPPEPPARPAATVLLAEDEEGIRALVRKILQKQGYQVLEAASGEEALSIAANHPETIDILLTDVVMPGINGGELASRLQSARPELKVLFMSGYTGDDLATFGPLPDGAEFLQKPFSLAVLLERIRAMLD